MQVTKRPKNPAKLLADIKTVDGAGSGLDADTLDGQQASAFAGAGHNHDSRYYQKSETYTKAETDAIAGPFGYSLTAIATPQTVSNLTQGLYLVGVDLDSGGGSIGSATVLMPIGPNGTGWAAISHTSISWVRYKGAGIEVSDPLKVSLTGLWKLE